MELRFLKLNENVPNPVFATQGSACFDLHYCAEHTDGYTVFNNENDEYRSKFISPKKNIVFRPQDRIMVPTGLIFEIPSGHSVRIHPRSGISLKRGLSLINCEAVVDSDYRHEVFILLVNNSSIPLIIENGERVAQGELIANLSYNLNQVNEITPAVSRQGGFGSTGAKDIRGTSDTLLTVGRQ